MRSPDTNTSGLRSINSSNARRPHPKTNRTNLNRNSISNTRRSPKTACSSPRSKRTSRSTQTPTRPSLIENLLGAQYRRQSRSSVGFRLVQCNEDLFDVLVVLELVLEQ